LVVWMVRRLVDIRLAILPFIAGNNEAHPRVVKQCVAEDFQQLILEDSLVMLCLTQPPSVTDQIGEAAARWKNSVAALSVDLCCLIGCHACGQPKCYDAAGGGASDHIEMVRDRGST